MIATALLASMLVSAPVDGLNAAGRAAVRVVVERDVVQADAVQAADTLGRLRSRARAAEARFERLARNLAPFSMGGFSGYDCDEVVGRFCLRFDSTLISSRPSAPEVGRVIDARREAVEAQRRYFSAAPAERAAAGPLVRLLILDDRAAEAVAAARAFAALSGDTLWAQLLLGLALNASGRVEAAERAFVRAFARMDEEARREWTDPEWLLAYDELRRVRRLAPQERGDYERRFWLLSDPLWLTAPNERWIEHMARHVESRLMAEVPVVTGMIRWGRDLDELTVRYGTPSSRSQVRGNNPWDPSSFIEYFDTAQRAYSPERLLLEGLPPPPFPGDRPSLYSGRARSGYALRGVHRLVELPHQVTRFLAGDSVLVRVDGALVRPVAPTDPTDPTDPEPARPADGARPLVGLFAYDSAYTRRIQAVQEAPAWTADTVRFSLSVRAPAGAFVYSVEALDTAAGYAAQARYSLDAFIPDDGPVVSDLLVCQAFGGALPAARTDPALRPLHDLAVARGSTLGVYAEVYRRDEGASDALRIEFALEPAEGPALLTRIARWIGRTVGVAAAATDPRVAWREEADVGTHAIAVNLPVNTPRAGRYLLVLRVTEVGTGLTTETRRPLLVY